MTKTRSRRKTQTPPPNSRRRKGTSFGDVIGAANRRAHERVNQRSGRRGMQSIRATIDQTAPMMDEFEAGALKRLARWAVALLLLPPCWITAWTFLARFSRMTNEGFWQSREFWYFAVGAVVMGGWFASGLLKSFFLYLYVLGHELTHAVFVLLYRGKVTDFHVSTSGGYITTNKTNLVIALSPYFVPLWAAVAAVVFALLRLFFDLTPTWNLVFYGVMGVTWTFHLVWTLWMIPRDQPDLKENGTFLSLVVILFANLLVLVGLLCVASENPWDSFVGFGREWLRHAAVSADVVLRSLEETARGLRAFGKF